MIQQKNKNRRVVVTGLGVVSSLGIGWEEFWKNLIAGKSGISQISAFDVSEFAIKRGGEVKDFKRLKFSKRVPQLGRASQMAISAIHLALKDSGLDVKSNSLGITVGTTMGEPQVLEQIIKNSYKNIIRRRVLSYPANAISNNIGKVFHLEGLNIIFSNACAAGNYAVGYAFDEIRTGKAQHFIAGGVDALSRIAFTGFNRLIAMAPEICQPFDKNRKGMMMGEGAGFLILEELTSALKRKANIYAEIIGYGMSCDAHHMTNPSTEGISKAIKKAILDANIVPNEIEYISAHGTGTIENDKAECSAYYKVFAEKLRDIPISSIKSSLGHTMGAAAALESIACCLVIHKQEIPPTINFNNRDSECDIDCVPNFSRKKTINILLNNSQAFGGNNACIVLKRIQ